MSNVFDEITSWPAHYIGVDGERHDWDEQVPVDVDAEVADDGAGYTFRDLAVDRASAQGMELGEFLERLEARLNGGIHPDDEEDDDEDW